MVTKATQRATEWMLAQGLENFSLAAGLDTDKKHLFFMPNQQYRYQLDT